MIKKGYKKTFEVRAYIVESLVTLNMPGLSNVCRRIDKNGIELANKGILDSRKDIIEIDLLVGNDLVGQIINWDIKPKRMCGQLLLSTHFGWTPSGPVPLSCKAMNKESVNLLVANVSILNTEEELEENMILMQKA